MSIPVKNCNDLSICNITVQNKVKDQKDRITSNFPPIIKKTQLKLNQWLQRVLSIKERVLLSKAEGLSRLTYAAISLHVDGKTCKDIDRILFNFLWKNKTHYIN